MRITFLAPPPNLSGGIRVIAQHASWLASRGHEVWVAHPPALSSGFRDFRSLWTSAKTLLNGAPATHFDALQAGRIVLPSDRPPGDADLPDADVIVATWWETAEWVARLSASKGAKAYFVQGHEIFDHLPKDRVRATYRLPIAMITVSEWLKTVLREEYGASDISLVPNGVDLVHFHAPVRGRQSAPTVGMVYSAERMKGCDISIAAVRMLGQAMPGLRLLAFGPDPAPRRALPLPRSARYVARPAQQLIPTLYAECDAWLFGSRSEGFGLPVLEAMACRTPVVAAPAGAAPELMRAGGGIQVPPEDPRAMAEAVMHLCRCPEAVWSEFSRRAWETAQAHSLEQAHQRFEHALLGVVTRRASAGFAHASVHAGPQVGGRGPAFS